MKFKTNIKYTFCIIYPFYFLFFRQVFLDSLSKTVQFMINQKMGKVTYNNDGPGTEPLTILLMQLSREGVTQSFNNYRRHMGLYAYKNFYDLTRNWEIANKLEKLYDHIEDVELLTGLLTEKPTNGFAPTVTIMMNSFIINSILTNPITSKALWNPVTFGGDDICDDDGYNIVRNSNIQSFIYNNLADKSNNFKVSLYAK